MRSLMEQIFWVSLKVYMNRKETPTLSGRESASIRNSDTWIWNQSTTGADQNHHIFSGEHLSNWVLITKNKLKKDKCNRKNISASGGAKFKAQAGAKWAHIFQHLPRGAILEGQEYDIVSKKKRQ